MAVEHGNSYTQLQRLKLLSVRQMLICTADIWVPLRLGCSDILSCGCGEWEQLHAPTMTEVLAFVRVKAAASLLPPQDEINDDLCSALSVPDPDTM